MRLIHKLLCLVLIMGLEGCFHSDSDSSTDNTASSVQPSSTVVMIAAAANWEKLQIRFSLNNPWTKTDTDRMNVTDASDPDDTVLWIDPAFETRIFGNQGYEERLKQCKEDFKVIVAEDGSRKCYPDLVIHNEPDRINEVEFDYRCPDQNSPVETIGQLRYGYFCGGGHPVDFGGSPPPMDAVDSCCRFHDLQKWGKTLGDILSRKNEKGIIMCLSQAKSNPIDLLSSEITQRIVKSRHCWYDHARWITSGAEPNDPPPPEPY